MPTRRKSPRQARGANPASGTVPETPRVCRPLPTRLPERTSPVSRVYFFRISPAERASKSPAWVTIAVRRRARTASDSSEGLEDGERARTLEASARPGRESAPRARGGEPRLCPYANSLFFGRGREVRCPGLFSSQIRHFSAETKPPQRVTSCGPQPGARVVPSRFGPADGRSGDGGRANGGAAAS